MMLSIGSSTPADREIRLNPRHTRPVIHRLVSHRLVTHLLLALALLVAQAGAQAHAYSHLQSDVAKSDLGSGSQLCRDCLAFVPVASPGGSSQLPDFVVTINTTERDICSNARPVHQSVLSYYRSRAPPALL
jgi:hypothetical protein